MECPTCSGVVRQDCATGKGIGRFLGVKLLWIPVPADPVSIVVIVHVNVVDYVLYEVLCVVGGCGRSLFIVRRIAIRQSGGGGGGKRYHGPDRVVWSAVDVKISSRRACGGCGAATTLSREAHSSCVTMRAVTVMVSDVKMRYGPSAAGESLCFLLEASWCSFLKNTHDPA